MVRAGLNRSSALLDFRGTTENHSYSAEGSAVEDWVRIKFRRI